MKTTNSISLHTLKNVSKSLYISINNNRTKIVIAIIILGIISCCKMLYKKVSSDNSKKEKLQITTKENAEKDEFLTICTSTGLKHKDIIKVPMKQYCKLKEKAKNSNVSLDKFCEIGSEGNAFFLGKEGFKDYAKIIILYGEHNHYLANKCKGPKDLIYIDTAVDLMPKVIESATDSVPGMAYSCRIASKKDLYDLMKDEASKMFNNEKVEVAILDIEKLNELKNKVSADKESSPVNRATRFSNIFNCYHEVGNIGKDFYVYCKEGTIDKYSIHAKYCF